MTIFWHQTGPLMRYEGGALTIEDLNPQIKTTWVLSRSEMLRIGWRFLVAAVRRCA